MSTSTNFHPGEDASVECNPPHALYNGGWINLNDGRHNSVTLHAPVRGSAVEYWRELAKAASDMAEHCEAMAAKEGK